MRILQLVRQYSPAIGGIEHVVQELSVRLAAAGCDVRVACLDRSIGGAGEKWKPAERIDGVEVRRRRFAGSRQYAIAPGVIKDMLACDLIHVHSCDFLLDYAAGTRFLHRKPIVLTTHGLYFHTPACRTLKKLYFHTITRNNLRSVDRICCVSRHDRRLIEAIAPPEKITPMPNGVDLAPYLTLPVPGRSADHLVSVGRLADNKRIDCMLRTFSRLTALRPSATLTLIGPDDDGSLARWRALSDRLGVASRVRFAGALSADAVRRELGAAKIWLSSSGYESFGLALVEAMAAGCIPIVQDIPAFREILGPCRHSRLIDFDAPQTAAQVIASVMDLTDAESRETVGELRKAAEPYDWGTVFPRMLDLYREVLAGVRS